MVKSGYVRVGAGALAFALALGGAALGACSGASPASLCGPGTRLSGSTCVPSAAEAGGMDAGVDVEEIPEDAGSDAEVDDSGADDPCPKMGPDAKETAVGMFEDEIRHERFMNCDATCGAVSPFCGLARCRTVGQPRWPSGPMAPRGVVGSPVDGVRLLRDTIRLPRDPWVALGGECDPDPAMRPPTLGNSDLAPYAVANPQPKFSMPFEFALGWDQASTAPIPALIDGRSWTFRTVSDVQPTLSGALLVVASRLEPLFDVRGAYTSFEQDRVGCVVVNHRDYGTNVPKGHPPSTSYAPNPRVIFFTNRTHIPATNIVLDVNPTATCGVSP